MAYSGFFRPEHPEKYLGDPLNIVFRSLWERKFMKYCDTNTGVLKWASEEFHVPYVSPIDGKVHRYFPDFYLEVNSTGGVRRFVIEIKPKAQATMPEKRRRTKKFLAEVATVAVNHAKWEAAEKYCQQRRWTFLVLTEDHLFDRLHK